MNQTAENKDDNCALYKTNKQKINKHDKLCIYIRSLTFKGSVLNQIVEASHPDIFEIFTIFVRCCRDSVV